MLAGKHINCVHRLYAPSSHDTTSGTKSDDIRRRDGANGRSCCIIRRPCKEARASRESTNGDQEDTSVLDVRVRRPSHNRKASNRGEREEGEIDATTIGLVRNKGDCNGNYARTNVRWHRV